MELIKAFLTFYCFTAVLASQPLSLQDEPDLRPWAAIEHDQNRLLSQTTALPRNLNPIHYTVHLRPILEEGAFIAPGEVNITLECVQNTDSISVNFLDIAINHNDVKLWDLTTGTQLTIVGFSEDTPNQVYTIFTVEEITAGSTYVLYIPFTSQVPATPLAGLYRSSYVHPVTNVTHYLATTQFQRDDARRAFPCFDEPGIRSIFQINLGRKESFHSLSNMPLASTTEDPELDGWFWDHYEETVVMPSYLLAMIVSDFESEEAPAEEMNGKISATWGVPHRMANNAGVYGAVTSARAILAFENIFSTSYDLPKLDSVAVPDFAAGAMENWGLVTYRENLLLYVNGTNTEPERRSISSVISHELAHQWFGNLVTCATWADIWLNEGFATFVSYWGMNATDPEYEPLDWIVPDSYQPGMDYDATANSQPIHHDGSNPSRIIYQKAGSVIRMMSNILTEGTFTRGLVRYLIAHSYGSVRQDDLFTALTAAGHEEQTLNPNLTMKEVMDTWTYQSGFPLIRVIRLSSTHLSFTQESYGSVQRKVNTTVLNPSDLWWVPLTLRSATIPDTAPIWFNKTLTFITHGPLDTRQWVLINPGSTGFYRVHYDIELSNILQQQLLTDMNSIPATSRSQILDDYFKFAFIPMPNNYTSISRALDWTRYLDTETSLFPWLSFFNNMGPAFNFFSSHAIMFPAFKGYFGDKINSVLTLIGPEQPETERGAQVILRSRLLEWNCAFGDEGCRTYSQKLFSDWNADPEVNPVPADLRAIMYCAIVASGDETAMEFAKAKYTAETNSIEKTRWLNAIACTSETSGLNELFDVLVNGTNDEFTRDEKLALLRRIAVNPDSRQLLLDFIQTRFDDLLIAHNATGFRDIVTTLSTYLSETEDLESLRTLIDGQLDFLQPVLPALQLSLTTIQANVQWMEIYGREMAAWFIAI